MSAKFNFTKAALDAIKKPAKRTYFYDTKTPGLALAVTPTGAKSFYFIRWVSGRSSFIKLENGTYPPMTIEQARAAVAALNAEAAKGIDPAQSRRQARAEMTLDELFKLWTAYAKSEKRSSDKDERTYALHLSHWANRRLSQLSRDDIVRWHQKLGRDSGPYAANRALALLRAMFNRGVAQHGLDIANPATGIKLFREEKREGWITPDAMPRLLEAIDAAPSPDWRDFFKLALFTGARRGNVLSMSWRDINLSQATWSITGAEHKTKKPVTIPLAPPALEILECRKEMLGTEGYVFPGVGKSGHLQEPKKAWAQVLEAAGLSGLRVHDLRHTLASWMSSQGVSLTIVGKTLGHSQTATTARYAHLALDPVREAVDRAAQAMTATQRPKAEVIPLDRTA